MSTVLETRTGRVNILIIRALVSVLASLRDDQLNSGLNTINIHGASEERQTEKKRTWPGRAFD